MPLFFSYLGNYLGKNPLLAILFGGFATKLSFRFGVNPSDLAFV
jgi:hypothetical protein